MKLSFSLLFHYYYIVQPYFSQLGTDFVYNSQHSYLGLLGTVKTEAIIFTGPTTVWEKLFQDK